jgi:DNA gyrase subunit A
MLSRSWPPGAVSEMLERSGAASTRPDGLAAELGLTGEGYRLSEAQAQAILDMRLHRLTGLEQGKIVEEFQSLLSEIGDLSDILALPARLTEVVRSEIIEIRDNFGDPHRNQP